MINQASPGARLKLAIRRKARERVFEVETRPFASVTDRTDQTTNESEQTLVLEMDRSFLTKGVKIKSVRPSTLAARVGLRSDDVIVTVNHMQLGSLADFQRMQRNRATSDMQLWQIRRGDQVFFMAVREKVVVL
jgi:S1-C subfamily serine protease